MSRIGSEVKGEECIVRVKERVELDGMQCNEWQAWMEFLVFKTACNGMNDTGMLASVCLLYASLGSMHAWMLIVIMFSNQPFFPSFCACVPPSLFSYCIFCMNQSVCYVHMCM